LVTVNKRHQHNLAAEGFEFESWLAHIRQKRSDREVELLRMVYAIMDGVVDHQQHLYGESELFRALMVAEILADLHMDTDMLLATLLHSLLQVEARSIEDVKDEFGGNVATLVSGMNKMRIVDAYHLQHEDQTHDRQHIESVRKLLLALAEDVRVVIIKLAERLQIMRSVRNRPGNHGHFCPSGQPFGNLANQMGTGRPVIPLS
jgi:(p)ppGpp synthase/HD superfamily hydrolase